MSIYVILATNEGVVVSQPSGDGWQEVRRSLEGQTITSVIARQGVILAGTRQGVFRSDDLGLSWIQASAGLDERLVRWMAYHPDITDFELAGTEPAGIYISRDGARSWRVCSEVTRMRAAYNWSLPYSPRAGCVRGFAISGSRAYAAVEDGAVLVSDDGGEEWTLAKGSRGRPDHHPASGFVHSDVHSIAVHPKSPERVYAPTGGGLYTSHDGGRSWSLIYAHCYCRAVWLDPDLDGHLLLGPADGVDYNGRIEESLDDGQTWQMASSGLSVPWPNTMVERFIFIDPELLAILSNGEVWAAHQPKFEWQPIFNWLPPVNDITSMTAG
ncbi:MAG: hypothetical protein P8Z00_05000 [Anaerolineales bacterium]|jgi:photosystem II stability/assembly factor-like uncharacterized protein